MRGKLLVLSAEHVQIFYNLTVQQNQKPIPQKIEDDDALVANYVFVLADIKINTPLCLIMYCHNDGVNCEPLSSFLEVCLPTWSRLCSRSWVVEEAGGTALFLELPREVKNSQLPSTSRPQVRTRKRETIKERLIN